MKVKYTGLYERIYIEATVNGSLFKRHFSRNIWSEVPDDVGEYLLKSPHFLSKECFNFSLCDKNEIIYLKRGYALGDLIQLIPVIKYMKRAMGLKFGLYTSQQYVKIMEHFNIFEEVKSGMPKKNRGNFFILDGILELDHSLVSEEHEMHRIKIYEKFFNINVDYYDFTRDEK